MLELDGREIGVLATPAGENGARWGALLYDNVPGGAGHVRELLEMGREWLVRAKDILFIDDVHNKRCRSACLDCLLSFETQDALQQGNLDRPSALAVLSQLLNGGYALLYDNVPGGAGHVRELLEMGREWLVRAKDILFIDDVHNKRCRSACLDCLLSFETQDALQQGNLDRPSVSAAYSPVANPHAPDEGTSNLGNPTRAQQLTTEERQTRAQAKTPNGSR